MDINLKWPDDVPVDHIDTAFLQGMLNRMAQGFYTYGHQRRTHNRPNNLKNIEIRVEKYEETGNTEWLIDAANYCMMEFSVPSHHDAHFRATSREESPGSTVSGKRVKGKEELKTPEYIRKQRREGD